MLTGEEYNAMRRHLDYNVLYTHYTTIERQRSKENISGSDEIRRVKCGENEGKGGERSRRRDLLTYAYNEQSNNRHFGINT